MNELPFEVILFVDQREFSRSHSPGEQIARSTARWHCQKSPNNSASIVTKETGLIESFRFDGGEIIDSSTGNVIDECPGCKELRNVVVGLEIDLRSANAREIKLREQKEERAEDAPEWEEVARLFAYYRERTGRKKSRFTADRFECALPLYKKNGMDVCMLAIDGIAFDPNTKQQKNGAMEIFNSWQLLFRNQCTLERYANRAPMDKIKAFKDRKEINQ
jgi:hypothetical protein